ncbi:MAG: MBL fold metallo-hydrolase, partial [Bacteroidota bacterium]
MLQSATTTIVFDTGPDFRQQMLRADVRVLDAVVFTHHHKDHVAGMDDVRAYNFLLERDMPIYGQAATLEHLRREYYYIFEHADYPGVPRLALHTIEPYHPFSIGDILLEPLPYQHGGMQVLGYRTGNFAYLTDVKDIPPPTMDRLHGLDTLVVSALRKTPHHSHLNLEEALSLIEYLKPKRAFLTHISHLMGRHAEVSAELPEHVQIAWDGLGLQVG